MENKINDTSGVDIMADGSTIKLEPTTIDNCEEQTGKKKPVIKIVIAIIAISLMLTSIIIALNTTPETKQDDNVKATQTGEYNAVKLDDTTKSKSTNDESSNEPQSEPAMSPVETQQAEIAATEGATYDVQEERQETVKQATEKTGQQEPTKTKTQVWIPDIVTIVYKEAYDEPTYETTAVYKCNCGTTCATESEIASHTKAHMKNGESTSYWVDEKQTQTGSIHHDAVTHTEDHGHYEWQ